MRRALASFALIALIGCGGETLSSVPAPTGVATFVALVSDPGELLSGGAPFDYSTATARITARPLGAQLAVRVVGDRVWDGFLALRAAKRDCARVRSRISRTPRPPAGRAFGGRARS